MYLAVEKYRMRAAAQPRNSESDVPSQEADGDMSMLRLF
ncbi:MAG: hypothetical protein J07HR59_01226 [Halorubrum sp. J07HR59]|nr:MAG: hypothetical protein J07HR59_01226 [Halorubrum sp. J07HR59]